MSIAQDPNPPGNSVEAILNNYLRKETAMVESLFFSVPHPTVTGSYREEIWKEMFSEIIPKKFVIEQSVFIIDSYGEVSKEVDLAIFDEMYTPYIFRSGRIKFLPIEAVAAVVECKSLSPDSSSLVEWVDGIRNLKTSQEACVRIANFIIVDGKAPAFGTNQKQSPSQTATRPLRILCCLNNFTNLKIDERDSLFDFIVSASDTEKKLSIEEDTCKTNLDEWYFSLNHAQKINDENITAARSPGLAKKTQESFEIYKKKDSDKFERVNLLSFNLLLNQLLMLINNPIWFPHAAYARLFNEKKLEERFQKEDCYENH